MRDYRWLNLAIAFALSIWLSIGLSQVVAANSNTDYDWHIPAWMPKPVIPEDNPLTTAKVELGRHLFYEKKLSVTGNYSCASCHKQSLAFTDGKVVGIGATDESHPHNSMSLANICLLYTSDAADEEL
jgi:cytochrome c peroxidase